MNIQFGAHTLQLKLVPELKDSEGNDLVGQIYWDEKEIVFVEPLWEAMPNSSQIQALWHEFVHAIKSKYKIDISEDNIDKMAEGITEILLLNPEYFVVRMGDL